MKQTCSICGRTLCRIGLTDLPSRSLSWTPQLRRVSLLLGNKGSGSSFYTRWPSASQFVLKQISEVTWLQCEINTTVFLQTKNQQKINNAKKFVHPTSLLPRLKRVLTSLFSIKRSILEFTLHTLERRCNQSLSLSPSPCAVSLQDINMRKAFKSSTVQDQKVVSKSSIPNPVTEMYNLSDKPPPLNILSPYRYVSMHVWVRFWGPNVPTMIVKTIITVPMRKI